MAKKDEERAGYEHPALTEAIRAAALPRRKPTAADGVPATKLPTTRAQREAIRLARSNGIRGG